MYDDEVLATHLQELRRGTVVLACLLLLKQPGYGYALIETLESSTRMSDALPADICTGRDTGSKPE